MKVIPLMADLILWVYERVKDYKKSKLKEQMADAVTQAVKTKDTSQVDQLFRGSDKK